jgi:CRP/FNR family transcriptional regulator, cyclic AMP receptor protein
VGGRTATSGLNVASASQRIRRSSLEIDPELGSGLAGERFEAARRDTIGLVRTLPSGHWSWSDYRRFDASVIGLFVIEGLLAREVSLSNTICTELLGHGDLLRPLDEDGPYAPVPSSVDWTVLEPTAVAVLDARFAAATARWPEVLSGVTGRAVQRARWLSVQLAIRCLTRVDVRVLVLFWHLADRWGRVERNGVHVPMRLTHELLGRLIAVRRAKVWLFSIVTNLAKDRGAREARSLPFPALGEEVGVDEDDPERKLIERETRAALMAAIGALPRRQRMVITLRDVCGLSGPEVCDLLRVSPGNQRLLLHRARRGVRERLNAPTTPARSRASRSCEISHGVFIVASHFGGIFPSVTRTEENHDGLSIRL